MNYLYIAIVTILAFYTYSSQRTIKTLRENNLDLQHKVSLTTASIKEYETSLANLKEQYIKGLETLSSLKNEKEKEVHYVTRVKEKIINGDTNSSCISAINAIYERLYNQRSDDNKTSRSTTNGLN